MSFQIAFQREPLGTEFTMELRLLPAFEFQMSAQPSFVFIFATAVIRAVEMRLLHFHKPINIHPQ